MIRTITKPALAAMSIAAKTASKSTVVRDTSFCLNGKTIVNQIVHIGEEVSFD